MNDFKTIIIDSSPYLINNNSFLVQYFVKFKLMLDHDIIKLKIKPHKLYGKKHVKNIQCRCVSLFFSSLSLLSIREC